MSALPTDAAKRKAAPVVRGFLDYFPLAAMAVAELSRVANEQHNPGEPMRWAKEKSPDHADCIVRHLLDRGKLDTDGQRHSAKVAWRAMALLQTELEAEAADKITDAMDDLFAKANEVMVDMPWVDGAEAAKVSRDTWVVFDEASSVAEEIWRRHTQPCETAQSIAAKNYAERRKPLSYQPEDCGWAVPGRCAASDCCRPK